MLLPESLKPAIRAALRHHEIGEHSPYRLAFAGKGQSGGSFGAMQGDSYLLGVEAQGPRARLRAEVAQGLAGGRLGEGLGGHWVQAYFLHVMLKAAGGHVDHVVADEKVILRASVPIAPADSPADAGA